MSQSYTKWHFGAETRIRHAKPLHTSQVIACRMQSWHHFRAPPRIPDDVYERKLRAEFPNPKNLQQQQQNGRMCEALNYQFVSVV